MRSALVFLILCGATCGQVQFDGTASFVDAGPVLSTIDDNSSITMSAWVTMTDGIVASYQCVFGMTKEDVPYGSVQFYIEQNTGKLMIFTHAGSAAYFLSYSQNPVFSDGQNPQKFIAAVINTSSSTLTVYVDGTAIPMTDSAASSLSGLSKDKSMYVGARNFTPASFFYLNGKVDDARIYSRALSGGEIGELYHRPWSLADDTDLVLRTCIPDEWDESRVRNYGSVANGETKSGATLIETANGWAMTNGYIAFAADDQLQLSTNGFTYTARVKASSSAYIIDSYGGTVLLALRLASGGYPFGLIHISGVNYLYNLSTTSIADGEFHDLAWVVSPSNSTGHFYIDGVLDNTATNMPKDVDDAGTYVNVGAQWNGSTAGAKTITDARIYNRPLTPTEVMSIVTDKSSLLASTNLVVGVTMQPAYQGLGSTLTGTAKNYGTGADGTYSNGPTVASGSIQHVKPKFETFYPEYNTNLVRDISGNDNTATNCGVDLYETSSGWAGAFDGVSSYMTIPTNDIVTQSGTIVCLVKTTNDSVGTLFSFSNPSTPDYFDFCIGDGSSGHFSNELISVLVDGTGNRVAYISTNRIELFDGNSHYVAISSDGSEYKIYLDGVEKLITVGYGANNGDWIADVSGIVANSGILLVASVEIFKYNGVMQSLYYYNSALASNDIYTLSQGIPITTEPIANWTMQPEFKQ